MKSTSLSKITKFYRQHPRWRQATLVVVIFLLIGFVIDNILLPIYTRQGSERAIPVLTGLSMAQAMLRADSMGFKIVAEPAKIGGHVQPGTVIEQRPIAGALAKPGRKLHLVPAAEAPADAAPDVTGLELRDALLRVKSAGLLCGESDIRYRFSERYPKNQIVSQEPIAGHAVKSNSTLKLWVSMGPQPDRFIVPYMMEKPLPEARILLRDAGLKLGKIVRKPTNLYANGLVIAQSVRSGEEVQRDTAVDIVVAVPETSQQPN